MACSKSCGSKAVDSNTALLPRVVHGAAEYKQVKRSLRRYDPNVFEERDSEEEEVDSAEEERSVTIPGLEKVDDVMPKITKVDDFVEKASKSSSKWKTLV
ncbi:hypothetical protein P3T76_007130 [Phytophthora citrophthora]|uniref:Uncharacterized protein n=1 Tax=Phytophthora citrophthora TaxID=4793 RepID=A0AAD9GLZ8_9STRA|nr:hypothetical protein P3T76_007130 [Phytophthora citrophthora]